MALYHHATTGMEHFEITNDRIEQNLIRATYRITTPMRLASVPPVVRLRRMTLPPRNEHQPSRECDFVEQNLPLLDVQR